MRWELHRASSASRSVDSCACSAISSRRVIVQSWSAFVGRVLRLTSYAAVALSLALAAGWALGRALTDSTKWSQYLFWMPTVVVAGASLTLIMLAAAIRWFCGVLAYASVRKARLAWGEAGVGYESQQTAAKQAPGFRKHIFKAFWALGALAALGVTALSFVEWSGPGRSPDFHRAKSLRFVFWNDSEGLMRDWEKALLDPGPDVAIMKPGTGRTFGNILEKMGPNADFVYTHGFAVVTKAKIKRRTHFTLGIRPGLGIDPRRSNFHLAQPDSGTCWILELATSERLGRDITVYIVDLPSDPSLWRDEVMHEAKAALEKITADVWRHDDKLDRWLRIENPEPFGPPDVLIGDMNTPRGSRSIKLIARDMQSAYESAGEGYAATYPRVLPLWHLDQAFVAKPLRVGWYQVRNPGGGSHAMQILDVLPAK